MIGDLGAALAWRPQTFGSRNARQIRDPVIEPLWSGVRVLVLLDQGDVQLRDEAGATVRRPPLAEAIAAGVDAWSAVLDGYVTSDAARSGVGVHVGPAVEPPTPADMARQMLMGGGASRRKELLDTIEDRDRGPEPVAPADDAVLVVVDLLLLDGQPLLDVPLLERKRLLDSVVVESDLVRVGIHVRAPVDPWLGTWRKLGFRAMAYKDANSRYRPGAPNEGWASADIPRT